MTPTKTLHTLGYLAATLQRSPDSIEAALTAAGVAPDIRINGVAHFDAETAYRVLTKNQPIERRSRRGRK
jgi:hypothetical protein